MAKKTDIKTPEKAEKKVVKEKKVPAVPTAACLASRLRACVRSQGNYTEDLEPAIAMCAGAYRTFLLARRDVDALEQTYYTKITTMGNEDIAEHPVIRTMEKSSEMLRKCLGEVGLTLKTLTQLEEDPIEELAKKMEQI